ncbi:MAG: hypothetical protein ACLS7Z_09610 [Christensenellales bacterium]
MNLAGYQFVTLGNHDFNYGVDALMDYLTNLDALCLCANIRDREGRLPIAPYAVHRLENGLRIGLVGVCTHFVRRWENPKTVEKLVIEPIPAAKAALDAVKPLCDVTVLIYHGGFECDLETGEPLTDSAENQACRLCRELDFDLRADRPPAYARGRRALATALPCATYRAPHCCGITVTVGTTAASALKAASSPPRAAAGARLRPAAPAGKARADVAGYARRSSRPAARLRGSPEGRAERKLSRQLHQHRPARSLRRADCLQCPAQRV